MEIQRKNENTCDFIYVHVSKIDIVIFSVRKKKNLLKESKVWILTQEQLLQLIFKRYIVIFVALIFLEVEYCIVRRLIIFVQKQVNHINYLYNYCI